MSKIFCRGIFLKVLLITFVLSFGFVQAKRRTRNIPLLNNVKAPLFAEFDFSSVNKELENLITENVEYQVNDSCIDKIEQEVEEKQKDLKTAILQVYSDEIKKLKDENAKMLSSLKDDLTLKFDEMKQDGLRYLKQSLAKMEKENAELKSSLSLVKAELENHKPGFTAFGKSYGTKSAGQMIKFPDIKSSFGLTNLSTFGNTGEFVCEKSGIYLISVTMMSKTDNERNGGFYILKNKNNVGRYYIGMIYSGSTSSTYNSGSGTTLVQLHKGDTISVTTYHDNMYVYDDWSSITVIKQN